MALKVGDAFDFPLWGNGKQQTALNRLLLAIALFCVPIMLVIKPVYLNYKHFL